MVEEDEDAQAARRFAGSSWTGMEIAAVGFLAAGGLLFPVIGPVLALFLVWLSSRWRTREKVLASVIAAFPLLLVVLGIALGVDEDTDLGPADWLVILGFPLSGVFAATYLSLVLSRSTGRRE
jgi:hypothetical protein